MIHSIDCIERFFRISFYFLCGDYFKVCKRKYSKFQKISEKRILLQVTVNNNTAVLVVLLENNIFEIDYIRFFFCLFANIYLGTRQVLIFVPRLS